MRVERVRRWRMVGVAVAAVMLLAGCSVGGTGTGGNTGTDGTTGSGAPAKPNAAADIRPDTTAPASKPGQIRVSFYGDSYTLGTGASSKAKRWSTIICEQRGWSEFNPSVNGLGFVNNRQNFEAGDEPAAVIESRPDILFITMGLNDNFSYDFASIQIRKQIGADFARVKAALPKTRIIVVEPFWYTDQRPKSLGVIIGWVKAAAAGIHADYVPGASHWIEHHPEWMAADGLHPNDVGYAHMAVKMDAALTKLGLRS